MTEDERLVANQIRAAFHGVRLGDGVGLHQGQGLDDYAGEAELAALRSEDEKEDWSTIAAEDLDWCYSSLSFFDAEGMRFHLPAYLAADLEGRLRTAEVLFSLIFFEIIPPQTRFDVLSPAQREAVCAFLRLRLADPSWEHFHPNIEAALRDYWAPASPPG